MLKASAYIEQLVNSGRAIREIVFDPMRFASEALRLEAAHGIPLVEWPQSETRMTICSERLHGLVVEQRLRHPGVAELDRHVTNALAKPTPRGWRLVKSAERRPDRRRDRPRDGGGEGLHARTRASQAARLALKPALGGKLATASADRLHDEAQHLEPDAQVQVVARLVLKSIAHGALISVGNGDHNADSLQRGVVARGEVVHRLHCDHAYAFTVNCHLALLFAGWVKRGVCHWAFSRSRLKGACSF